MSKMIKLMNKMSDEMANSYKMKLNASAPSSQPQEPPKPAAQQTQAQPIAQAHPAAVYQNPVAPIAVSAWAQPKFYYTASMALISLVLLVATTSLLISYTAIQKINFSQGLLLELAEESKPHNEKLAKLTKTIERMQKEDQQKTKEVLSLVKTLGDTFDSHKNNVRNLKDEHKTVKMLAEELKTSDKLLVNKFIALNNEVKELKKLLSLQASTASNANIQERN